MPRPKYDFILDIGAMPAQEQMDRLLENFVSGRPSLVQLYPGAWQPAIDICETSDEIIVVAELAGVGQDDIEVLAGYNSLLLRGERKSACGLSYHQMEIPTGAFQRTVLLPATVDPSKATASCRNGLLAISLPKQKQIISSKVVMSITFSTE